MSKECLDEASVGTAPTEVTTNYSDTEGESLTNLDDLIDDLLTRSHLALDRWVVSSVSYLKDNKKFGIENISELWKIEIKTTDKTIAMIFQKSGKEGNTSLSRAHSSN